MRTSDERRFMHRAIELAEHGRGRVSPNPLVGAVIVRDGRIVGEGWHCQLGAPHAEAMALAAAGPRARGATMFVTLEPCAHTGRTPPCAPAIVAAGIRRCVVGLRDPHTIVNGRGLRLLRRAGVRVELGLCAAPVREQLAGYLSAHLRGRPRVTWKVAATLDGRIADARGRSRWITGPAARHRAHEMRAASDAIVVGAGTARRDDPRLTVRMGAAPGRAGRRAVPAAAGRPPLRVVCARGLELPLSLRLFGPRLAPGTVVACGPRAPRAREAALVRRGVRVWRLPLARGGVSGPALLRRLVREGCYDVLLEGGASLGTAWLRGGLVDRVALFVAPRILGAEGLAWCGPLGRGGLVRALPGRIVASERCGDDLLIVTVPGAGD